MIIIGGLYDIYSNPPVTVRSSQTNRPHHYHVLSYPRFVSYPPSVGVGVALAGLGNDKGRWRCRCKFISTWITTSKLKLNALVLLAGHQKYTDIANNLSLGSSPPDTTVVRWQSSPITFKVDQMLVIMFQSVCYILRIRKSLIMLQLFSVVRYTWRFWSDNVQNYMDYTTDFMPYLYWSSFHLEKMT